MRFALVTDAWAPQVNGVVRTWTEVVRQLEGLGHHVLVIHPGCHFTVPIPKYPEIRLALFARRKVRSLLDDIRPHAIHIATEGPLGLAGRVYCLDRDIPFTTSYHTQYAHYLSIYYRVPSAFTWSLLRWFHRPAVRTLVPTRTVAQELLLHGFQNTVLWSRGVDTGVFRPSGKNALDLPRPIFLTASRIAEEKNIKAFLELKLPGSKVVVGDGPARAALQRQHPEAHWTGYKHGDDLARLYSAADVFVFPSRTDTFGVTMLEANACGVPVAAFPVTGPIDVIQPDVTGVLNHDLRAACIAALNIDSRACVDYAHRCTWEKCAHTVIESVATIPRPSQAGMPGDRAIAAADPALASEAMT
jgi:glycosyltransferase involved in cell wall biosynthesis